MKLTQERFVIKVDRGVGHPYVFPYTFVKRQDAEDAKELLAELFNTSVPDMEVDSFEHVPHNNLQSFLEFLVDTKEYMDAKKDIARKREEYLEQHLDEYYNSELREFVKKPTPQWSYVFGGWWRYVSVEEYEKHTDYYREYFEESGAMTVNALLLRAPQLVNKHQKETRDYSIYEQRLMEGESVNINLAGGYNSAEPDAIVESEFQPNTEDDSGGLSGILMPDGEFCACMYGKHHELIAKLKKHDKYKDLNFNVVLFSDNNTMDNGIVMFSYGFSNVLSEVISSVTETSIKLTTDSIEWLSDNKKYMTDDQKDHVERLLSMNGVELNSEQV